MENILDLVKNDATTSLQKIATKLVIPQKRVINILHEPSLPPYHEQRVQHLQPGGHDWRMQFCNWKNNNGPVVSRCNTLKYGPMQQWILIFNTSFR